MAGRLWRGGEDVSFDRHRREHNIAAIPVGRDGGVAVAAVRDVLRVLASVRYHPPITQRIEQ